MRNIYKYLLPILGILFVWTLFSGTSGIETLGNANGKTWGDYYYKNFFSASLHGTAAQNLLFNIFFVLAGFLFVVALIVAFMAAIRLFMSNNSEEDFSKWLNTLLWSILWLFLVAISYTFVKTLSETVLQWWWDNIELNAQTIYRATINIIYPILNFLRYVAAICFFCVIVYAFYRIIFSLWNEEWFQNGKRIFITATIGFIIMLLAEPIVKMAYGGDNCFIDSATETLWNCGVKERFFDANIFLDTAVKIIIFLNGFIALVTVLMIMYAGVLILTGWWDEEKSEKAKKIITYAIIGVLIIVFSYVLYRALLFIVN